MKEKYKYEAKPIKKLKANFSNRKSNGLNSFKDFDDFLDWYNHQEKKCHYCGIEESVVQKIVMTGILKSSRFPQKGIISRGRNRGVWLEVDRIKPKENYSRNNCVLSCYFCNNDKSDIFNRDQYNKFKSDRAGYLREIFKSKK